VSAGRIGRRAVSLPWGWGSSLRSALLVPALVASLVAWLVVAAIPAAAAPNSLGLRATYNVQATVEWSAGTIDVSTVAHVKNTTSSAVTKLTFNLLPLRLSKVVGLTAQAGGKPVTPNVSGQSVIVPLAASLAPGAAIDVAIDYEASFNTDTSGKRSLLMKKNGIAAAYRWIPWLSRVQRFSTPNFGESWVTATSPRVTVRFTADKPLTYATSGKRTAAKGNTQTFVATNVRDFNFSASPNYSVKKVSWGGIKIKFFYRTLSPATLQTWTIRALERFTNKVGRYPYDHLSVAETPAGVGMESPAMTWIDGTLAKSRTPYVIVHETAHQWFYSTVGNNQATKPFADEAVADFLTRDLLNSFRKSSCAQARLDKTVYGYQGRCYNEVIYVQGGLYLRDYKDEVGANRFWNGLNNFYRNRKFGIATTRGLLEHLDAASGFNSQRHEDRFPSIY
jgi:cytoskeletal protein RodZ